jgi:TM2 domain-containing membrane protein YozV
MESSLKNPKGESPTEQLTKLSKLHTEGVLSDNEFTVLKGNLIAGLSPVTSTPSVTATAPIMGEVAVSHRGKSKTTTAVLAVLIGGIGMHRFYLGTWGWGIVYIILLLFGITNELPYLAVFFALCEAIRFSLMKQPDFDAKYNYAAVGPFTF